MSTTLSATFVSNCIVQLYLFPFFSLIVAFSVAATTHNSILRRKKFFFYSFFLFFFSPFASFSLLSSLPRPLLQPLLQPDALSLLIIFKSISTLIVVTIHGHAFRRKLTSVIICYIR